VSKLIIWLMRRKRVASRGQGSLNVFDQLRIT